MLLHDAFSTTYHTSAITLLWYEVKPSDITQIL